ncbi:MAG TPA: 3-deoxy-D-manno-octulosonic acid transferase [Abditibacteriaceae bacterium]|jgi:3-deoxy-D-manno-octulosonic-acid transferase
MNRNSARRFYHTYNALLAPLLPAVGAYTLYRRYGQKKSAESLRGQWGVVPETLRELGPKTTPRIWVHAVSVGETLAARPVLRALRQSMPEAKLFLSTTTDTGQETARAALRANECDGVFYFPLDAPLPIKRVLRALQPDALLMLETELWPNVLHLVRESGAEVFLVNGRVSDNLLQRAPKLGRVWRWMMGNLSLSLMRSEFDAQRLRSLGAPKEKVLVTGDVKLDAALPESNSQMRDKWRSVLEIGDDLLWVAGSTHEGEDEIILRAHVQLREQFPSLRLVLAPRHVERAPQIEALAAQLNIPISRRTTETFEGVSLLDTVGELGEIYAAADAAFVGGSLIPRGGHNVLEPPLRGVAVAFGPHVANFREAAALVESANCGQKVSDEKELVDALQSWLGDETLRREISRRAHEALQPHRGAATRVAEIVRERLSTVEKNRTSDN